MIVTFVGSKNQAQTKKDDENSEDGGNHYHYALPRLGLGSFSCGPQIAWSMSNRHVSYSKSIGSSFSWRFFFGFLPPLIYGECRSADNGFVMGHR